MKRKHTRVIHDRSEVFAEEVEQRLAMLVDGVRSLAPDNEPLAEYLADQERRFVSDIFHTRAVDKS